MRCLGRAVSGIMQTTLLLRACGRQFMKRNYFTVILAVGVAVLLVILGVLQYRWQTQISENEAQRMHKLAQEYSDKFAEDFNREIQGVYFNFDVDAESWRDGNYRPFVERYDFWR